MGLATGGLSRPAVNYHDRVALTLRLPTYSGYRRILLVHWAELEARTLDGSPSMSSRRHIALLTTTLDVSGAERVLALLANGLAEAGYRVSVVALQRRSGHLARLIHRADIDVVDLGMRGPFDLRVVWRLRTWLRQAGVSVVYTFLPHAHIVGRLAGRLAGVSRVLSSQQVANWGSAWRQSLEAWTDRWCDRIVAVSDGVKDDLVHRMGVPAAHIAVIFNAIPVSAYESRRAPFTGTTAGAAVFGSASRLAPEKDHASLIRGFAEAYRVNPRLRLRLAGTGPLAPALKQLIGDLHVGMAVEMLGQVTDIQAFYDSLDVYVQPSRTEGLPCAVIEAMAMERPVIATNVPGNRDAVVHGDTGWLIEPSSPSAWATALLDSVQDRTGAVARGRAGRQRTARLFDSAQMMAGTLQLLRDIDAPPQC